MGTLKFTNLQVFHKGCFVSYLKGTYFFILFSSHITHVIYTKKEFIVRY